MVRKKKELIKRDVALARVASMDYMEYNNAMNKIHGKIKEVENKYQSDKSAIMADTKTPYFKRKADAERLAAKAAGRIVRLEEISRKVHDQFYGKGRR